MPANPNDNPESFFDPGWYPGREEVYIAIRDNAVVADMATPYTQWALMDADRRNDWPPPRRTDSIDTIQLKFRKASVANPDGAKPASTEPRTSGLITLEDVTHG